MTWETSEDVRPSTQSILLPDRRVAAPVDHVATLLYVRCYIRVYNGRHRFLFLWLMLAVGFVLRRYNQTRVNILVARWLAARPASRESTVCPPRRQTRESRAG